MEFFALLLEIKLWRGASHKENKKKKGSNKKVRKEDTTLERAGLVSPPQVT